MILPCIKGDIIDVAIHAIYNPIFLRSCYVKMMNLDESSNDDKMVLNLLKILFQPEQIAEIQFFEMMNFRLLVAVLLNKDIGLLVLMQAYYQKELRHIHQRFQSPDIDEERKQEYLRNYLCILPYFEFADGCTIDVPWFDADMQSWELKNYKINKIRLNQQYFWMNQADLCYAYGLQAQDSAHRLLIISGTSYPCGEGFWPHVVNDISIGLDVGYFLYRDGKAAMLDFIKEPRDCEALGTSLGGAMALQLGLDYPNLKFVYAINPPGRIAALAKETETAPTLVVIQENDFVSKFGYWHPSWDIVHYAFKPAETNKPAQFFDHFSNYALLPNVNHIKVPAEELNQNRFWLTSLIFIGLRALCTVVLVWPIRYLIIPILKLIYAMISAITACLVNNEVDPIMATPMMTLA